MKNIFFSLLCFFTVNYTLADPFYGETTEKENKKEVKQNMAKKSTKTPACELPENVNEINLPVEFEDLKLVGVFKYNNKAKALFVDKSNQIFDFAENDFLKDKSIQINEITTKFVKYINWDLTEDCQFPYQITLKL